MQMQNVCYPFKNNLGLDDIQWHKVFISARGGKMGVSSNG